MKKVLSMMLVVIMLLCMIPSTAVFAAKGESIDQLALTITAPKEGEKPSYDKLDGRGYYSDNGLQGSSTRIFKNGIAWFKSASSYFSPGTSATFEGNTEYIVKINLLPKGNFEFGSNITTTINGITATVETYDDGSILVVATLTSAKKEEEISQLNLSVTAPVDGAKPSFDKIDGVGYYSDNGINGSSTKIYKNGIAWYKSASSYISSGTTETFKGGTDYTVKVALTAKEGYKFAQSVTAKINGKTATVETFDDGSINVSVKFTASSQDKNTNSKLESNTSAPSDTSGSEQTSNVDSTDADTSDNSSNTDEDVVDTNVDADVDADESADADESETETDEQTDDDNDGAKKKSLLWLWIVICVLVVGAGGTVVFLVLKKKKSEV